MLKSQTKKNYYYILLLLLSFYFILLLSEWTDALRALPRRSVANIDSTEEVERLPYYGLDSLQKEEKGGGEPDR